MTKTVNAKDIHVLFSNNGDGGHLCTSFYEGQPDVAIQIQEKLIQNLHVNSESCSVDENTLIFVITDGIKYDELLSGFDLALLGLFEELSVSEKSGYCKESFDSLRIALFNSNSFWNETASQLEAIGKKFLLS